MNVIHGTWIPKEGNDFIQHGTFYFWVETDAVTKKKQSSQKKIHPMHLTHNDLETFLTDELGIKQHRRDKSLKDKICYKYFILPSNRHAPLPSLEVMKYQGMEIPEDYEFEQWEICCFKADSLIKVLNDIHFLSFYDTEIQLGSDLLFWYHYTRSFKEIVLKDQYIPALKYREYGSPGGNQKKKSKGFEIYPAWEIISEQYESDIQKYISSMPIVCTTGSEIKSKDIKFYSRKKLLRHFSECILNEIVTRTPYTAKLENQVSGSFLYGCISPYNREEIHTWKTKEALEEYNKWLIWKKKLTGLSYDVGFHLCFQLIEAPHDDPEQWRIEFILASKKDPSLRMSLSDYWFLDKNSRKSATDHFGRDFEKTLMLNLGYAARMYTKIWDGLETDKPTGIRLNMRDAHEFLKESAWILEDAGYKVIVPSWWTPQGRQKARIRLKTSLKSSATEKASGKGYFSLESIIKYKHELSIGGQIVTTREWRELIHAKTPLVQFRGQWIELDRDKMKQMIEFWQKEAREEPEIGLMDMIKMSSESEDNIEFDHDQALSEMLSGLYEKGKLEPIETPSAFNGLLRPYQKRGVSWLEYLEGLGLNPCLADDMGLGKTIQVIARMVHEKDTGHFQPTLLIAPTSVLGNWEKEVERFAPHLRVHLHHGSIRIRQDEDFKQECLRHDMVLTSFALIRKDSRLFQSMDWKRIVVDEAQNIKNPKSAQTKAILKLNARHRLALTGTPIENRLLDLWSIFNFLNPGYLSTTTQFRKTFEMPIQKENDLLQSKTLKKLVEPFILRRVKTDREIIKDLPDKVEQKIYCNLTKEQASLYEAVVRDVNEQIETSEGIQRKGLILSTLMKLKQICNHPMQFLQDSSEFTKERSHKLERLSEMIEEVLENNESLLIFSQFKEIGDALVKYMRNTFHCNTYYIHGGTTRAKRQQMIDEFQDSETEPSVFILSLKAGGVGITLTKANHVFHFDRWWNPAVEDQATDRAFRIGQKKNVFVHKYVAIGTLEERIDTMIEDKKRLSSSIVGADESWLTELDNESFKKLIKLNKSAIMEEE